MNSLLGHCQFRVPWPWWSCSLLITPAPKIIEITISFPEFLTSCTKSVYPINSFFVIHLILQSHDQCGNPHFWPCLPKMFLINLKFSWICINIKKTFITLFWRNQYLKIHSWQRDTNPSILQRHPTLPTSLFSNFDHLVPPHTSIISFPPSPRLLLPCFFDRMGDCITSDVLF